MVWSPYCAEATDPPPCHAGCYRHPATPRDCALKTDLHTWCGRPPGSSGTAGFQRWKPSKSTVMLRLVTVASDDGITYAETVNKTKLPIKDNFIMSKPEIYAPAMKAIKAFEADIAGCKAVGLPMTEDSIKRGWASIQTIYAVGFRKRATDADSYRLVLDRIGTQLADLEVAAKHAKPVDPFLAALQSMTVQAMATAKADAAGEGDE